MPTTTVFMSFDGKPIVPALPTLQRFWENEWDTAAFENLANSYRCPIGEEIGRGYLLMVRSDVQQINSAGYKTLVMGDGLNGSVTFPKMIFVKATRLIPGASQDPNALYLVEIADRRFILPMALINRRYDLRYPNAPVDAGTGYSNNFAPSTSLGGVILTDIAGILQISVDSSNFPSLTSIPENYIFEGISAWSALNKYAHISGAEIVYNPIADTFAITGMGLAPATAPGNGGRDGLTDAPTNRTPTDGLLEDAESFIGAWNYPEGVTVCFPNLTNNSNTFSVINRTGYGTFYNVDILGSSISLGNPRYTAPAASSFPASRAILHDPTSALWSDISLSSPDNLSALQNRATEIATAFYHALVDNTDARQVQIGAKSLTPGPVICEVTWRDWGDGLKTEIQRYRTNAALVTTPFPPNKEVEFILGKSNQVIGKGTGAANNVDIYSGLTPGSEAHVSASNTCTCWNHFAQIAANKWVLAMRVGETLRIIASEGWMFPTTILEGTFSTLTTAGNTGTFTNATVGTVTVTVPKGICLPSPTKYLMSLTDSGAGIYQILNPDLVLYGQFSAAVAAGGSGTLTIYTGTLGSETSSGVTVTAFVRSGAVVPGKTYIVGYTTSGAFEVLNPDGILLGQCSSVTLNNTLATFTLFSGTQGSETSTGITVSAWIREGLVFSGITYRIAQALNGYEVENPSRAFICKNLTGADIAKAASGTITIMTGAQGAETSSGVTATGLARWGIFKNNAIGRAVLDEHISGAAKWTIDDTDTC